MESRRNPLRMVAGIGFLLAGGLGGPAAAQQASTGQGLGNIFSEVTEVNVVNVDVVVTDRDGRPVTGLTAEDFVLLEDGEPVEITNFYAVEGGLPALLEVEGLEAGEGARVTAEASPAPPESHLVVFVDNANISPAHRTRVLQRLREHLQSRWHPGLRVTLMSNDRSVTLRQPPTERPEELFAAIDALMEAGSRNVGLDRDLGNLLRSIEAVNVDAGLPYMAIKGADEEISPEQMSTQVNQETQALVPQLTAYAQVKSDEIRGTLKVLGQLVESVAGLPGRKAVVYVSDGLSLNPSAALFEIYDRRFAALGSTAGSTSMAREIPRYDLTADFRRLTTAANAGRVTFYTIDASPPAASRRGGADQETAFVNSGFANAEDRNEQESLVLMAEETGGRASLSASTLDDALEAFLDELETYYSLGYVAERREGERSLEVRLREPSKKLKVRHRANVRDKTLDQQIAERTLSALLLETLEDNPLEVVLETAEIQPAEGGNYSVPVIVKVPLEKLVLVPGPREHQAQVAIFVAVLDEKGRTSPVIKQLCPIRVANSDLLLSMGRQAGCGMRLLMRPGEQQVAVAVRDELASIQSTVRLHLDVAAGSPEPEGR